MGIIVNNDALLLTQAERIARLAMTQGMPTLVFAALMMKQGALLSYGPDQLASALDRSSNASRTIRIRSCFR